MTPSATAPLPVSRTSTGFGRLLVAGLAGGAAAGVVNLALYFATHAAGVPFLGEFEPGSPGSLPLPMVFLSGLVMALPASAAAWGFGRFTASGARNYVVLATVFGLVSLGGPLNVPGLDTGSKVVMELMHVVAAVGIVFAHLRAMKR
jgi:hypothetical protein